MNRRAAGEPQAGLARHTTMVCSSARMAGCRSRQIAEIRLSGAAGTVATPNGSAASGDAPINNMVSTPMRDTFPMEGLDTSASRLHRVSSRPFDQKDSEIRQSRKSKHQHYFPLYPRADMRPSHGHLPSASDSHFNAPMTDTRTISQ